MIRGYGRFRRTGKDALFFVRAQEHRSSSAHEKKRRYPVFFRIFLLMFFGVFFISHASLFSANNFLITNVSFEERDAEANTVVVKFDISWDNSWRTTEAPYNYDAVWVFLKVCKGGNCSPFVNLAWIHGMLNASGTDPADADSGSNTDLQIDIPQDRVGAFLYRRTTGSGTMSSNNVLLTMNYGEAPLSATDTDAIQVKVFGVEMVYVPDGNFYIGDGNGASESPYAFHVTDNTAAQITSSLLGSVTVDTSGNDDIDTSPIGIDGDDGLDIDDNGTVDNDAFPTGYSAFWLMKYELTQGQYRDFLNTLTQVQQHKRTTGYLLDELAANQYVMASDGATTPTARDTIKAGSNPSDGLPYTFGCDLDDNNIFDEAVDGEWIAMNYMSWMGLMAYADWAGLRPMTELEFEKAARGSTAAVYAEYTWGSTTVTQAEGAIQNSGITSEVANTTGNGLANYNGVGTDTNGPLRVGFAATSATSRVSAGSGYYGSMDLSGNVYERVVTVGNATGRAFQGTHGDGVLTTTASYEGNATNTDWPGINGTSARGVTGATGSGILKGSFYDTSGYMYTSARQSAASTITFRHDATGGRLARSESLASMVLLLYVTTETHDGDFYTAFSNARIGLDDFCTSNKPTNLPVGCTNHHAFVSVSYPGTDPIKDMPENYGYYSGMPIYWWHDANQEYTMLATDWADMLDGTIAVSQTTGTGDNGEVWTGSDPYGDVDVSWYQCSDFSISAWETASSGKYGRTGVGSQTNSEWLTYTGGGTGAPCSYSAHLRCACQIEVEY